MATRLERVEQGGGAERVNGAEPLPFGSDGVLPPFGAAESEGSRRDPWDEVDGAAAGREAPEPAR